MSTLDNKAIERRLSFLERHSGGTTESSSTSSEVQTLAPDGSIIEGTNLWVAYATDISGSDTLGRITSQDSAEGFILSSGIANGVDGIVYPWIGLLTTSSPIQSEDPTDYIWSDSTVDAYSSSTYFKRFYLESPGLASDIGNPDNPVINKIWSPVGDDGVVPANAFWLAERYTIAGATTPWQLRSLRNSQTYLPFTRDVKTSEAPELNSTEWNEHVLDAIKSKTGLNFQTISELGYGTVVVIQYSDKTRAGILKLVDGVSLWVVPSDMVPGDLIVDGSINAEQINAEAISASHLKIQGEGAISSETIGAGTQADVAAAMLAASEALQPDAVINAINNAVQSDETSIDGAIITTGTLLAESIHLNSEIHIGYSGGSRQYQGLTVGGLDGADPTKGSCSDSNYTDKASCENADGKWSSTAYAYPEGTPERPYPDESSVFLGTHAEDKGFCRYISNNNEYLGPNSESGYYATEAACLDNNTSSSTVVFWQPYFPEPRAKFFVGDSDQYIDWNGVRLEIGGNIITSGNLTSIDGSKVSFRTYELDGRISGPDFSARADASMPSGGGYFDYLDLDNNTIDVLGDTVSQSIISVSLSEDTFYKTLVPSLIFDDPNNSGSAELLSSGTYRLQYGKLGAAQDMYCKGYDWDNITLVSCDTGTDNNYNGYFYQSDDDAYGEVETVHNAYRQDSNSGDDWTDMTEEVVFTDAWVHDSFDLKISMVGSSQSTGVRLKAFGNELNKKFVVDVLNDESTPEADTPAALATSITPLITSSTVELDNGTLIIHGYVSAPNGDAQDAYDDGVVEHGGGGITDEQLEVLRRAIYERGIGAEITHGFEKVESVQCTPIYGTNNVSVDIYGY